jgi:anthranilate phosphoribosyltransferase
VIREVLSGSRRDEARAIVVANAAAALFVGGMVSDLREAAELAQVSIEKGAALMKLEQLIAETNK